jgi:hypothetical protein
MNKLLSTKKITLATLKSFIKRNENEILIKVNSTFDGMTDCVMGVNDNYTKLVKSEQNHEFTLKRTLGYDKVWLVGQSNDYFRLIDDANHIGINVFNCVGSFDVVIKK